MELQTDEQLSNANFYGQNDGNTVNSLRRKLFQTRLVKKKQTENQRRATQNTFMKLKRFLENYFGLSIFYITICSNVGTFG